MPKNPTFAFFGTPTFAVSIAEELKRAGYLPALVITAPDKPVGRGGALTPPPMKLWATEHEIDMEQPEKITDSFIEEFGNTEWDVFIVAAYGALLPAELIEIPRKKTLNVHPSLLPKLRGSSPIQSAILTNAKNAVGVSIMQIDEEMDHGPLVAQASVVLEEWPLPGRELERLLATEGGRLLAEVLSDYLSGAISPTPQDHAEATYTKKIMKEDGEISLDDDPWQTYLKIRAFDGWPGTYFFVEKEGGDMVRVKVVDAEYEDGELHITRVIPEGKNEMDYEVFLQSLL